MTQRQVRWSAGVYVSWFLAWVVLELLGYWRVTPWVTLSEFVWNREGKSKLRRLAVYTGFSVLAAHLAVEWP